MLDSFSFHKQYWVYTFNLYFTWKILKSNRQNYKSQWKYIEDTTHMKKESTDSRVKTEMTWAQKFTITKDKTHYSYHNF